MGWQEELQGLSDEVLDTFGESVAVTRAGGTLNPATGARDSASSASVTLAADVQQRQQFPYSGQDGAKLIVEQVVFLFDVAEFAATALVRPRQNDTVTHGGFGRRVVGADLQVGGKMWRVTTRTEKKV